MKKIIAMLLLSVSSLFILVSCGGKSVKQVVNSYVNAMSYKEKAFVDAVFPEDKKVDAEKITKSFEMFESEYGLIKAYFDGAKFEDEKGLAYGSYYKDSYGPMLDAYVVEARSFTEKIKAGEGASSYLDALWDYDGKFVVAHNGFLELLEK